MGDKVICHSGFTYAQRPKAFLWDGAYLDITEIWGEWRTPEGKTFRVRTRDDRTFLLSYDESTSEWQVEPQ